MADQVRGRAFPNAYLSNVVPYRNVGRQPGFRHPLYVTDVQQHTVPSTSHRPDPFTYLSAKSAVSTPPFPSRACRGAQGESSHLLVGRQSVSGDFSTLQVLQRPFNVKRPVSNLLPDTKLI